MRGKRFAMFTAWRKAGTQCCRPARRSVIRISATLPTLVVQIFESFA